MSQVQGGFIWNQLDLGETPQACLKVGGLRPTWRPLVSSDSFFVVSLTIESLHWHSSCSKTVVFRDERISCFWIVDSLPNLLCNEVARQFIGIIFNEHFLVIAEPEAESRLRVQMLPKCLPLSF